MAETEQQIQLVTFQLSDELYGIDIMDVMEIVRIHDIRSIPNAPSYVEGLYNLRGEIIPIINLHKRFNLRQAAHGEGEELLSGFIIIEVDGMKLGVIIDKVERVAHVEESDIKPPPQMLSGIGSEYIRGVVNLKGSYLIILDIKRLFSARELQKIEDLRR
ncbi:MAG TPA: chemotaxis protein CheW [Magnetospirillaceae bacterium]|nr:chemotaxis protein CheW [Magnetospirillaceae bacterium]